MSGEICLELSKLRDWLIWTILGKKVDGQANVEVQNITLKLFVNQRESKLSKVSCKKHLQVQDS